MCVAPEEYGIAARTLVLGVFDIYIHSGRVVVCVALGLLNHEHKRVRETEVSVLKNDEREYIYIYAVN